VCFGEAAKNKILFWQPTNLANVRISNSSAGFTDVCHMVNWSDLDVHQIIVCDWKLELNRKNKIFEHIFFHSVPLTPHMCLIARKHVISYILDIHMVSLIYSVRWYTGFDKS
jgi:hypothetical protein